MKKVTNLPVLSGENAPGRAKSEVSIDALAGFGNAIGGYSAHIGDTIEFPDTVEDAQVFTQPVRENGTAVQRLIVVTRNGKVDYFSLGCLSRRDIHGEPANNPFAKEMNEYDSDKSRVLALIGKTIKCTGVDQIETYAFDRNTGLIDRTNTQKSNVPVFEYV